MGRERETYKLVLSAALPVKVSGPGIRYIIVHEVDA